jgi:hypothetical protein
MNRIARRPGALLALALAISLFAAACLAAGAGAASPAPSWTLRALAVPTNFAPGDSSGLSRYEVTIANSGAAFTDGTPITVTDTLPAGLGLNDVEFLLRGDETLNDQSASQCVSGSAGGSTTVTCTVPSELPDGSHPAILGPSEAIRLIIKVTVPADASGPLQNLVEVEGGGAAPASATTSHPASPDPVGSGFEEFKAALLGPDGSTFTLAGGHPEQLAVNFAINTKATPPGTKAEYAPAGGDIKDLEVALPAGLVGNPTAIAECTLQQFRTTHSVFPNSASFYVANDCPEGSAVGMAIVQQIEGMGGVLPQPIYNLTPPPGVAAQFGFEVLGAPFYINAKIRTGSDYGITTVSPNLTESKRVTAFQAIFWGTPADPSHDPVRGTCLNDVASFPFSFGNCPSGLAKVKPFLRLPTSCETPLNAGMRFNTWPHNDQFASANWPAPAPTGCNSIPFEPTLQARPTTTVADAPTGLTANLHIPQENEGPEAQAQADLRKAEVVLPEGIALNPSGANGLEACSSAQIDIDGPGPASCPERAKIGTVEVNTPLLDHPLRGSIYVATPGDNPFGSLLAIYVAIDDPESGVVIKLAGHVAADPGTGQLTATFDENPQLPFEDFELEFFAGPRAALRTPPTCGTYETRYTLTPWSAPESGPPATGADSYAISQAPGGGGCATSSASLPGNPSFTAGTVAPIARAYSPFVIRLRREDATKEISSLNVSLPPGLLGKLAGIPYCPDSALAAAAAKSGSQEMAESSCPAASRVGSVFIEAGAGPAPYNTRGEAYLAGPYKGAPLSIAIVTPATAGPYDLGTVVVRTALAVDPETARITASSDPIPRILQGIPLDIRSIDLRLDRPSFTLNPTSCDPMSIVGQAALAPSGAASLTSPFQVGECGGLAFKPKLALRLEGPTKRAKFPALTATLTMPEGGANIAAASVALPHSEFLEQSHIGTICTRVQFAANACPAKSVYGSARAYSPLLDAPLEGPVYLRSSDHPLPDLVADLNGQIRVVLVGRIDSVRGGIRTSFESVPDAPVSKFVLAMRGGKKGLLVNSRNICAQTNRAAASFTAQNGKVSTLKPPLKAKCPKRGKHKAQH